MLCKTFGRRLLLEMIPPSEVLTLQSLVTSTPQGIASRVLAKAAGGSAESAPVGGWDRALHNPACVIGPPTPPSQKGLRRVESGGVIVTCHDMGTSRMAFAPHAVSGVGGQDEFLRAKVHAENLRECPGGNAPVSVAHLLYEAHAAAVSQLHGRVLSRP